MPLEENLNQTTNVFFDYLMELEKATEGCVALPIIYNEEHESIANSLLLKVSQKLIENEKTVDVYEKTAFELKESSSQYIFIFNERIGLLDLLLLGQDKNRIIVALMLPEKLEYLQKNGHIICHSQNLIDLIEIDQQLHQDSVSTNFVAINDPEYSSLYLYLALFSFWDIPLPLSLLSKIINEKEEDIIEQINLLKECEEGFFLIETGNLKSSHPNLAKAAMNFFLEKHTDIFFRYVEVIKKVETKQERYTILILLQSLAQGACKWNKLNWNGTVPLLRPLLLGLVKESRAYLKTIWLKGDEKEIILWGKFFEDICFFEDSYQVFELGINFDPTNEKLFQARARMLSKWAQFDEKLLLKAEQAFNQAREDFSYNYVVAHSYGFALLKNNKPFLAREQFDRAYNLITEFPRNTQAEIYLLITRANLEIDLGENLCKAQEYLEEAKEKLSTLFSTFSNNHKDKSVLFTFYAQTSGKLAFYKGKYEEAEEHFNSVLEVVPDNTIALTSLANMFIKRGHWEKAKKRLEQGQKYAPENVLILHLLGVLAAKKAIFLKEFGSSNSQLEVGTLCQESAHWFDKVLSIEESNIQTLTSYGTLLARQGSWKGKKSQEGEELFAKAKKLLDKAIGLNQGNLFSLHSYSKLDYYKGTHTGVYTEAEKKLEQILKADQNNIPSLISSIGIKFHLGKIIDKMCVKKIERILNSEELFFPTHEKIKTYNALAELYFQQNDVQRAKEQIIKAYGLDEFNEYTIKTKAKINF